MHPTSGAAPHAPAVVAPPPGRRRRAWGRRLLALGGLAVLAGFLAVTVGPRVLPYRVLYVRSGSMAPGAPVGSLALFRPARAASLHRGDVIAFTPIGRPGTPVAHRIVRIERTGTGRAFVTRGDANPLPDPWRIPARGSGWREVGVVPGLGYGLAALTRPTVRLTAIVLVALAGAGTSLVAIWRPRRATPGAAG